MIDVLRDFVNVAQVLADDVSNCYELAVFRIEATPHSRWRCCGAKMCLFAEREVSESALDQYFLAMHYIETFIHGLACKFSPL